MAELTLFNSVYNPKTERNEFRRTYIYDIDWQAGTKYSVQDKELNAANLITCFIPFSTKIENNKLYKKPQDFKNTLIDEIDGFFTFKNGDFIVKGIVEFELSNYDKGKKIEDLKRLYEVGTIINVDTNDFGSYFMQHWEVGAK